MPVPPPAKADLPVLPAAALGSEQSYNEQKGKGKEFEKGGKGEFKGGSGDKGKGKEFERLPVVVRFPAGPRVSLKW